MQVSLTKGDEVREGLVMVEGDVGAENLYPNGHTGYYTGDTMPHKIRNRNVNQNGRNANKTGTL